MTIRLRTAFFILIGLLLLWFLYVEQAILTPFILAAIFAYIFNPVVNFFSDKIKLPRLLGIIIIYAAIMGIVIFVSVLITRRVTDESFELKNYINGFVKITKEQTSTLPDWLRVTINENLTLLQNSKLFAPQALFSLFPEAISRFVSFIIFLFAGFYFLKEGRNMIDIILRLVPEDYQFEVDVLLNKINAVLNGYLRGQIFMIILVSSVLYMILTILGIRFALILAVFSGFAEIVPIIGPIVATGVAGYVALVTGTNNFGLYPFSNALLVIIVYFVIRQFQDYFVTPYVMGKITKLHPLVILFSVISGEHLGGILGLLLAVPIAAIIKILLEYSMDVITQKSKSELMV